MARLSQSRALGALFLLLAVMFSGIATAAATAEVWVIAGVAGILALWLLGLSVRGLRRR